MTGQPRRSRQLALVLAAVLLCAWCGWASGFHRSTTAAEATWVVSVGAVVAADVLLWRGRRGLRPCWRLAPVGEAWPRPGRGGAGPALLGVAPWFALGLLALTWDVLGLDTGPRQYHLTISALAQAYRPLNAGLLLLWMLVGIGYEAARVRAPDGPDPAAGTGSAPDPPGTSLACGVAVVAGRGHIAPAGLLLPQRPGVGVAFWVAVPVLALLVDRVARRSEGRLADAEELVRFASTSRVAHVVLVVAWGYAGYHLFAR